MAFKVYDEKFADSLSKDPVYVMSNFSLVAFSILSLACNSWILNVFWHDSICVHSI